MAHDNRQQIGRNSENNTMTKHSTGLVPKLRFPEFRNEREWSLMKIGDILDAQSSTLALNKLELVESGYIVYGADGIVGYISNYQHPDIYISIIKDGSGIGRVNLCEAKSSILGTLSALKSKDTNRFNVIWAYYLLNTIDFASYVKGAGIPHIYYSDYKSHKIGVPSPFEQQKIAACLSSLDELIAAENQKLNLLKEHKKGLLQNLFPQEGEKVPRLRFKEFEKDGEWVEKRLSQILKYGRLGGNYDNSDIKSGIPLIKMGNIDRGNINLEKIQYLPEGSLYDTEDVLKEGDLLFNTRNTLELVGKVAIWRNELPFALYNLNLMRMTFDTKVVHSNYFMNYHFNSPGGIKKLRAIATGTTSVAAIYTKDLLSISFLIPSLSEQQKIASTLSSLDELIQAQTQRIEALQLHKKGLLQGLFPETINN
jgi:type I restriction enzyme S subunit